MVSFVTDLAKTYVEKLINGAIAESRYICCFNCIHKEFQKEKVRLEAERITVGQRAKVATRRGDDIQHNVGFWEEEADNLIQEDTKTKQKYFFGLCCDCIWRYRRGKELTNKMENIKKLIETGQELAIGLPPCLPDVERYSSQYYISFRSRKSKCRELLDALKDDSNYITGLQGMGGTGKTTLAREVGKELKQSKQFAQVVDTTVSFTPNIKKIQDEIAGPLGLEWGENCNESDRPKKLWSRLTNGEKILVILDDVWGHINFDEIGIPYSDNNKGCRVLVTTRNQWVCNHIGCGRTVQLELLSKEDAWIMFKRHAAMSDSFSKSLLDKARKIANECKGLPVAIAVTASSLRGQQRQEEWDLALKSLQKPVSSMQGVDDNLIEIYKCLKFSYDYMKDEKAKGLFLLCSVFREDEEISTETLTRLGIGVGLFGEDYGTYEDARSQVVVAKNKLLDSCLLSETDGGSVRIHDLVREVAQWIANKEIQAVILSNKNQKAMVERERNIKYLLCEGKDIDVFSSRFDGSKLETLIVFFENMDEGCHHVEIPNSFFENIARLRVLHLSYQDQPTLSSLQSVQSLTNIRSLLVSRVDLGDISALGNLQTLERLDLIWSKIDQLPHEISKLEKFKLLNLEFCEFRKSNPFEVIKKCSSLEELYFRHSFNGFSGEITLPAALQRYHVCGGLSIRNDSLSKCVAFKGDEDGHFFSEATLKYLMQTAETLQLSGIGIQGQHSNLMPDIVPIDQGMNDLVELCLVNDLQLECLIDTKQHIDSQVPYAFSKLVVLHLYEMGKLKELCNGPISFDSLKSLEELSIECCQLLQSLFKCKLNLCNLKIIRMETCPMLVSLFQLSTSRSLVLLEELKIIDCVQLENIIVDGDNDNDNQSLGPMFPKLKVLDIQSCPRLEFVLPFLSAQDLSVLETINISFCDNLKYIFGQYQDVVELGSLKEKTLHELPNFISIFPAMSLSTKGSSPLSDGSNSKAQIQLDPVKCNCFSWTEILWFCRHKLRSTTSTKTPLVSVDQQQPDCPILSCREETEDQRIPEGSTSEKRATSILSDNSKTRIEPPIPLVSSIQKDIEIRVGEGTSSANAKTITSSPHIEESEDGNSQITEDVDVGDSQLATESNASAMNDINQLIKEDPLVALEKLLTRKVSVSSKPQKTVAQSETEVQSCSVGILLQELKTLMDSSDLDHLVSDQESKSKLISLFQQLNQHQGLLSSDIRDYVEKVQNFFSDHFDKYATSQLVLKKHNRILDSKIDLTNKLWSAKFTKTHIENVTSTAQTEMHELSSRIVDLRKQLADLENQRDNLQSVVDKCDVQKNKLKAECTQWAKQSKELLSTLASSEIHVREVEHARNLAKEGFANLKSLFPTF